MYKKINIFWKQIKTGYVQNEALRKLDETTREYNGKLNVGSKGDETKTRPRLLSWEAQRMKLLLTENVDRYMIRCPKWLLLLNNVCLSTTEHSCLGRK